MMLPLLLLMAGAAVVMYVYWESTQPNQSRVEPGFGDMERPVFLNGVMMDKQASGSGAGLLLPLEVLKQINGDAFLAEEDDVLIVTTKASVVHFQTDQLTALMNDEPVTLEFAMQRLDEELYVPAQPLQDILDYSLEQFQPSGAVSIWTPGQAIRKAAVADKPNAPEWRAAVRTEPTIKAPIMAELSQGEPIVILDEAELGWYHIQLQDGYVGHIDKREVRLIDAAIVASVAPIKEAVPWKPLGGRINLTWEAVYNNNNPNTDQIGEMPGLNVVSPTWFHLLKRGDGSFYVQNWADPSYVEWAHQRGYQVWALFDNSFDPDLTKEALATFESRRSIIRELLTYANLYNLQGINIDFENVYLEDGEKLTQFMRELTPLFHEQGLVVSIDVTIRGGSDMWSNFYNREELGKLVDYMMVMTYDEHWASSPVAGSVASLPWVEKGISDIIQYDHVPPEKLLLGVPYYTRIWTEYVEDGQRKVSSRALGMTATQNWIEENGVELEFDERTGQWYGEKKDGATTYKVWVENADSMRARADLVKKYDLAGIASWRRGFETPDIWEAIQERLDKKP
ncbi:hypothetical protein XYCOK13_38260 [Xylanibacillus composti]|uniref:GH18 domain-containing protein n=2 Tax=Xylanibacillus composti TaxID=1572762 RepID=A0A8J4M4B5_9BACL|nr:hypothetical protein XYCOK13_38260 [Xylanibacillus composti]